MHIEAQNKEYIFQRPSLHLDVVTGLSSDQGETNRLCVCPFGEGDGTPLQYSCLENPMDRGAWWAAVHGVAKSQTRLSDFTFTFHFHALDKEMATHSSVLAWRIPKQPLLAAVTGMMAEAGIDH